MENLSIIAAIGLENEIGIDNHLIWKLKEDHKFYRDMTMGKNLIMGRKTFESMPNSALIGRKPFVLSSQPLDRFCNVNSFDSIESIIKYVSFTNEEFMVVGGAQIYRQLLPYASTMYLTQIKDCQKADCYFPHFDSLDWQINLLSSGEENGIKYKINKYTRKKTRRI